MYGFFLNVVFRNMIHIIWIILYKMTVHRCWRRNVLVTKFKWCHQHQNSVNNITLWIVYYLLQSFQKDQLIWISNFAYFSMPTYKMKFEKIILTFQFIHKEVIEIPFYFNFKHQFSENWKIIPNHEYKRPGSLTCWSLLWEQGPILFHLHESLKWF